jgi:hypothetical protein
MTDKALSLVGPIITAYNAAEKAGADALRHALECGKHLCTAYETVTAEKGKGKWRRGVRRTSHQSRKKPKEFIGDLLGLLRRKRIFLRNAKVSAMPSSTYPGLMKI